MQHGLRLTGPLPSENIQPYRKKLTFKVILDVIDVVKEKRKTVRTEATQPSGRLRSLSRTRRSEQASGMTGEERSSVKKAEDWPMLWNGERVQCARKPGGHWKMSPAGWTLIP